MTSLIPIRNTEYFSKFNHKDFRKDSKIQCGEPRGLVLNNIPHFFVANRPLNFHVKRRLMNKNNSRRAFLTHVINKQAISNFSDYLNTEDDFALLYDKI